MFLKKSAKNGSSNVVCSLAMQPELKFNEKYFLGVQTKVMIDSNFPNIDLDAVEILMPMQVTNFYLDNCFLKMQLWRISGEESSILNGA